MGRWTAPSDYDYAEECGDPVPNQERSGPRLSLPVYDPRARTAKQKWEMSSRLKDRTAEKKQADALAKAFRAAVWARDKGKCQRCGVKVLKTLALDARRGEVHHKKPRSTSPELKYDVNHAELLCLSCHQKATRHL